MTGRRIPFYKKKQWYPLSYQKNLDKEQANVIVYLVSNMSKINEFQTFELWEYFRIFRLFLTFNYDLSNQELLYITLGLYEWIITEQVKDPWLQIEGMELLQIILGSYRPIHGLVVPWRPLYNLLRDNHLQPNSLSTSKSSTHGTTLAKLISCSRVYFEKNSIKEIIHEMKGFYGILYEINYQTQATLCLFLPTFLHLWYYQPKSIKTNFADAMNRPIKDDVKCQASTSNSLHNESRDPTTAYLKEREDILNNKKSRKKAPIEKEEYYFYWIEELLNYWYWYENNRKWDSLWLEVLSRAAGSGYYFQSTLFKNYRKKFKKFYLNKKERLNKTLHISQFYHWREDGVEEKIFNEWYLKELLTVISCNNVNEIDILQFIPNFATGEANYLNLIKTGEWDEYISKLFTKFQKILSNGLPHGTINYKKIREYFFAKWEFLLNITQPQPTDSIAHIIVSLFHPENTILLNQTRSHPSNPAENTNTSDNEYQNLPGSNKIFSSFEKLMKFFSNYLHPSSATGYFNYLYYFLYSLCYFFTLRVGKEKRQSIKVNTMLSLVNEKIRRKQHILERLKDKLALEDSHSHSATIKAYFSNTPEFDALFECLFPRKIKKNQENNQNEQEKGIDWEWEWEGREKELVREVELEIKDNYREKFILEIEKKRQINLFLGKREIKRFINILSPLLLTSMYSDQQNQYSIQALQQIFHLLGECSSDPALEEGNLPKDEQNPKEFIQQYLDNIYVDLKSDVTTHRTSIGLYSLCYNVKSLFHIVTDEEEKKKHLQFLLGSTLPGIDPNDQEKSILTFKFYYILFTSLPLIENDYFTYSELFYENIIDLVDRIFVLFHSRPSYTDNLQLNVDLYLLAGSFLLFRTIPEDLFLKLLPKLFKFTESNKLMNSYKQIAYFVSCTVVIAPDKLLHFYFPYFFNYFFHIKSDEPFTMPSSSSPFQQGAQASQRFDYTKCEIKSRNLSENEYLWGLMIFSKILKYAREYILHYKHAIVKLFNALLIDEPKVSMKVKKYIVKVLRSAIKCVTYSYAKIAIRLPPVPPATFPFPPSSAANPSQHSTSKSGFASNGRFFYNDCQINYFDFEDLNYRIYWRIPTAFDLDFAIELSNIYGCYAVNNIHNIVSKYDEELQTIKASLNSVAPAASQPSNVGTCNQTDPASPTTSVNVEPSVQAATSPPSNVDQQQPKLKKNINYSFNLPISIKNQLRHSIQLLRSIYQAIGEVTIIHHRRKHNENSYQPTRPQYTQSLSDFTKLIKFRPINESVFLPENHNPLKFTYSLAINSLNQVIQFFININSDDIKTLKQILKAADKILFMPYTCKSSSSLLFLFFIFIFQLFLFEKLNIY